MLANNLHQPLLEAQLPCWARQLTSDQWAALKQTQVAPWQAQDWYANAAPDLRQAVDTSHTRLQHAQAAMARSLKGLKQITEFAQPMLEAHLAERGFHAPLRHSQLLRVERRWHWVGLRYLYSHRRDNLLQAALQNFASDETFTPESAIALSDSIQVTPLQVQGSAPLGMQVPAAHFTLMSERYQVERLPLTPAAFASLCRELDLGGAYNAHLAQHFTRPQVRVQAIELQRQRLRLAADLAYLQHLLDGRARDQVERLVQGEHVQCWQLALFGTLLHDVMLIDAGRSGLMLYLPDHEPSLRQCRDLEAAHDALACLLLEPAERRAFAGYVMRDERRHFLDLLQQNLDASGDTDFNLPWQRAVQADLRPSRQALPTEPFGYYQDQHVARLLHEASLVAVPTATADAQARTRRMEEWESLGLDALMVAGFFVPAIGSLMLAVTACQLLGEVFEGYDAWEAGDRHLALHHLEAVGINLALIGGVAAAGRVLPRLFDSPLLNNLQEVRADDGQYKLWNQDLLPYRSSLQLPEHLQPNAQGQYVYQQRHFIRLDGELYEQRFDPRLQQWRIIHPQQPEAWRPPLEHNGHGAWRGAHEQPGAWSFVKLVRRLGERYAAFTAEQMEQAARLCGIDEACLRQVHLQGRPAPPLLLDTLQRMAAQAEVDASGAEAPPGLFDQLYDGNAPIDPSCQQLLAAYPRLSPALAKRLLAPLDNAESLAWQQHGKLPPVVRQQIEQVHHELPLVRALEGLLQPARASADSERLLFSACDAMPGWPADLRLELRAGGPDGPRLDHVGSLRAGRLSRVIKSVEGYEADLGQRPAPGKRDNDLCRAVEQALPRQHREALGIAKADGRVLRQRVLAWAAQHRTLLARRMWGMRAVRGKTHIGLRAGAPLEPLPAHPRQTGSLAAAYRRVFPAATDTEIADWLGDPEENPDLYDLRSATERVRALQQRLEALRQDLRLWAQADSARLPQRQSAIRPIINAWRRLSTLTLGGDQRLFSLDLSSLDLNDEDLASLALPDDFAHIEHVSLSNNRSLSRLPTAFCERFPNLRRLNLTRCRFDRLPQLAQPESLLWLDMDSNRLTWDGQAQHMLNQLTHLALLDLTDNPLLQAPDLHGLAQLRSLFLSGCALSELPQGLDAITEPFVLDLSANQFQQLPDGFTVPTPVANALHLESNWLSEPVLQQIEAYNDAHQVDLLVDENDYQEFFEETGPAEAALWQRLPRQYRRDLRALLDLEPFLSHPRLSREEFWRRLTLIDAHPALRQQWLNYPAQLFNLPL